MSWITELFNGGKEKEAEIRNITMNVIERINQSEIDSLLETSRRKTFSEWERMRDEIDSCIKIINKAIDMKPRRGEPFAVRSDLYRRYMMVELGEIRNSTEARGYLELANNDLKTAIKLGSDDDATRSLWEKTLKTASGILI